MAAETKSGLDIIHLFLSTACMEDDVVLLPEAFSKIQSSDANFEIVVSQTGQALSLQHTRRRIGQKVILYAFNPLKTAKMQKSREIIRTFFTNVLKVPDDHYIEISQDEILIP